MDYRCEEMQKAGLAIRIRGLKKEYRLGQIGSTTLQREIKRWWARKRGLEDPYSKIGQPKRIEGDRFMALNGIDLTIWSRPSDPQSLSLNQTYDDTIRSFC